MNLFGGKKAQAQILNFHKLILIFIYTNKILINKYSLVNKSSTIVVMTLKTITSGFSIYCNLYSQYYYTPTIYHES